MQARVAGSLLLLCLCQAGCNGAPVASDTGAGPGDGGRDGGGSTIDAGRDAGAREDAGPLPDAGPSECAADFAGCTTLEDHTADASAVVVMISGAAAFRYAPACIRIHAGQSVTLPAAGNHPLNRATCSPAATPVPVASTTGGTFTFDSPGRYGFFCSVHGSDDGRGMSGLIVVE